MMNVCAELEPKSDTVRSKAHGQCRNGETQQHSHCHYDHDNARHIALALLIVPIIPLIIHGRPVYSCPIPSAIRIDGG